MTVRWSVSLLLASVMLARAGNAQSLPQLKLESQLRIDGNNADLAPIGWIAVRRDGVIAVAQQQDGAVRFFDAQGRALGAFGRTGDGPGEFRSLLRAGWIGDTLWVLDGPKRRFTLISPQPTLLRVIALPAPVRPTAANPLRLPEFRSVYARALYADGSIQAMASSAIGSLASSHDGTVSTYVRINRDSTIRHLLVSFPPGKSSYVIRAGRDAAGGTFPLAIEPFFELSPDGSRAALVTADVDSPPAARLRVTMLDASGDTVYSVRHVLQGVPVSRAASDSIREASIREFSARSPTLAAEYRRLIQIPPVYPPVSGIVVGSDGTLWIRQRFGANGTPYLLLDPRGAALGVVTVPPGVDIRVVQGNTLWATSTDRDDVQSVVRYVVVR